MFITNKNRLDKVYAPEGHGTLYLLPGCKPGYLDTWNAVQGSWVRITIRSTSFLMNNRLDFGGDPQFRITIRIQEFLKRFLFTTAIPTNSQEYNMKILGGGLSCLSAF